MLVAVAVLVAVRVSVRTMSFVTSGVVARSPSMFVSVLVSMRVMPMPSARLRACGSSVLVSVPSALCHVCSRHLALLGELLRCLHCLAQIVLVVCLHLLYVSTFACLTFACARMQMDIQ